MKLEIDDISGEHIIRIPDELIEDLNWDEGDEIGMSISKSNGDDLLVVYLK